VHFVIVDIDLIWVYKLVFLYLYQSQGCAQVLALPQLAEKLA
jgi:hypothetical protein